MKKIILFLTCISLIYTVYFNENIVNVYANSTFSGKGTADNPYLIESAEDIEYLAKTVDNGEHYTDKYFKLTNDITYSGIPIGNEPERLKIPIHDYFSGIFDGDFHTITLNMTSKDYHYYGLFAVTSGATLKNVIINGTITSTRNNKIEKTDKWKDTFVGSLAGYAYNSEIYNVVNNASVTGTCYVGGIVCITTNSNIKNCINNGNLYANNFSDDNAPIGGIVASLCGSGTVWNCFNSGNINSAYYCFSNDIGRAGIVGNGWGSETKIIEQCHNIGSITKSNKTNEIFAYDDIPGATQLSNNTTSSVNKTQVLKLMDEAVDKSNNSKFKKWGKFFSDSQTSLDIIEWNGHKYQLFDESMTWEEAKVYCENLGGHLVTITSEEENNAICKMFDNNITLGCYWIGFYRNTVDSKWEWITNEVSEYANWKSSEPNNYGNKNECCAHIFGKGSNIYTWNDVTNSGASYASSTYNLENFGFICEWDNVQSNFKLSGEAIYDSNEKAILLCPAKTWSGGKATYVHNMPQNFEIKFDYKIGGGTSADGIVLAFFAKKNDVNSTGINMNFEGCSGYGLELDTYYNNQNSDSQNPHIAITYDKVSNHLAMIDDSRIDDENWHTAKLIVNGNHLEVYNDDQKMIEKDIEFDKTGKYLYFAATTGTSTDNHYIRNIQIKSLGDSKTNLSISAPTNSYTGTYYTFEATFDMMPSSAYLQFDSPADGWSWFSDEYCSTNPVFNIPTDEIVEKDGKYVYQTSFVIYSSGNASDSYNRQVRVAADINGTRQYSESTKFVVKPTPERPKNTIGYLYEQTSNPTSKIKAPKINNVNVNVNVNKNGNKHRLTVDDFTAHNKDWVFFYWQTDNGEFEKVTDDFKTVDLTVSGKANVTVTMGDGCGYITTKTIEIN